MISSEKKREKKASRNFFGFFFSFHRYKRGGVCCVNHRHAHCNHPCFPEYDASKPICLSFYLDANNLYGHAMTKPLPHKNIRFCTQKEEDILRVELTHHHGCHLENEGNVGWVFEVIKGKKQTVEYALI